MVLGSTRSLLQDQGSGSWASLSWRSAGGQREPRYREPPGESVMQPSHWFTETGLPKENKQTRRLENGSINITVNLSTWQVFSPFLKKLTKNAFTRHLGLEGPGFQPPGISVKCSSFCGCRSSVSCFVLWSHDILCSEARVPWEGLGPAVLFSWCPGFLTCRLLG